MTTKQREKELKGLANLFLKEISAGEAIARLDKGDDDKTRQALLKLLGGDMQRVTLAKYLLDVEQAFEAPEMYMTQRIAEVSKIDALRTYSLFPRFILPEICEPYGEKERDEFLVLQRFYLESGLCLINWERNSRYTQVIRTITSKEAEKHAWVSRKLFDLCDYMKRHCDDPYFKNLTPAAMWLFCEVSICKSRLANAHEEGSKRKRYDRMQKVYARLDSSDPADFPDNRRAENLKDLAENFYGYFMYKTKQMADNDPGFDDVLYKNYMTALKRWGVKALKAKGVMAYL